MTRRRVMIIRSRYERHKITRTSTSGRRAVREFITKGETCMKRAGERSMKNTTEYLLLLLPSALASTCETLMLRCLHCRRRLCLPHARAPEKQSFLFFFNMSHSAHVFIYPSKAKGLPRGSLTSDGRKRVMLWAFLFCVRVRQE